ncbi:MAG: hypothetical protein ACXV5Q_14020 [Frankiaceae bacterium]
MGAELAQAASAERLARSDAVLAQLLGLVEVTHRLLARAEADGRTGHALIAIRELRHTLIALGAVAQAVEARRLPLSGDDGETRALAEVLRRVLPRHPACAAELAAALDADQPALAGALRSLISARGWAASTSARAPNDGGYLI